MPTITMPPRVRASIRHTLALYGVPEARHALAMLEAGRVNGEMYMAADGCGCLIGSLQAARSEYDGDCRRWFSEGNPSLHFEDGMHPSYLATIRAQDWFSHISPGHTPLNSDHAALAADCIREWIAENTLDLAPANPLLAPEASTQAIVHLLREA